jgi:hypothetical protein
MNQRIDKICYSIISGSVIIDNQWEYKCPNYKDRNYYYNLVEQLEKEATEFGFFDDYDYEEFLNTHQLWAKEDEDRLKKLATDIDEIKYQMFQNFAFKPETVKRLKIALEETKQWKDQLLRRKNKFLHVSAKGFAFFEANKWLNCSGLHKNGVKVFSNYKKYLKTPYISLAQLIEKLIDYQPNEHDIRLIAKTDPWRSIWNSRKANTDIFGRNAIDLTDEQKALLVWTSIYDNAYESTERPSDDIIADDDVFDGYLIHQRKEFDETMKNKKIENGVSSNKKINDSQYIFSIAKSQEEIDRIKSLNTEQASIIKKERSDQLSKDKEVAVHNLHDVRKDIKKQLEEQNVKNFRKE